MEIQDFKSKISTHINQDPTTRSTISFSKTKCSDLNRSDIHISAPQSKCTLCETPASGNPTCGRMSLRPRQTRASQRAMRWTPLLLLVATARALQGRSAPRYMLDLYRSVAGEGGRTLAPPPHRATVVRCFPDKDGEHQFRFFFNISSNASKRDKVLEAEFHLFKLKPRARAKEKIKRLKSHLLEMEVHQLLHPGDGHRKRKRLLQTRRLDLHASGWQIFRIKHAIDDWLVDESKNLGLAVTFRSAEKEVVPKGLVRFAKRRHQSTSRQPLLVLFVDDRKQTTRYYVHQTGHESFDLQPQQSHSFSFNASEFQTEPEIKTVPKDTQDGRTYQNSDFLEHVARSKRDNKKRIPEMTSQSCMRHELYVDFEKIGWSAWIISPKGYNAYYCKGECAFPLDQNQWPTNHATVQSIVHELQLSTNIEKPCCVPNKLFSISLLYFDEHENVILKQYDDMVAASCGCH